MRNPLTTWYDRLNRYRIAAALLMIPFVFFLVDDVAGWVSIPVETGRRPVYWVGLTFLMLAIAIDTWDVYTGKRKVRKMVDNKLQTPKGG